MVARREEMSAQVAEGSCVRFMMCDSSVQHGRDYLMILTSTIKHSDLPEMLSLAQQLRTLWRVAQIPMIVSMCVFSYASKPARNS